MPVLNLAIELAKENIWPRLRIDGSKVRRTLAWFRLVDALAEEARALIQARGVFRVLEITRAGPSQVELEGGWAVEEPRTVRLVAGASKVALAAFTLGPELERRANALAIAGDHAEASLLSLLGDCALVEGQSKLAGLAAAAPEAAGLAPGVVLQPGAQYWGLVWNTLFERVLDLNALGVEVLDSFALQPAKSKTFAVAFTAGPKRGRKRWIGE